jgi:phosphoribosyl 1,2-cyclic phosphodiesterase
MGGNQNKMKVKSIYSSSSGNTCHISNDNTSILIDCGVSYKRLMADGEFPVDALFITHEHSDHVAGAGVLGRKVSMPIHIHEHSYEHVQAKIFKKCDELINYIEGGDIVTVGDFSVEAFTTRHDSKNGGLGYIITDTSTGKKFGYLTDTGSITKMMESKLAGCDAYLLEADYDETLLAMYEGYDEILKERIGGPYGHLSNDQIMDCIENCIKDEFDKVQWILFGHLSDKTNTPELVKEAFCTKFPEFKNIYIAPHEELEIV